jgi:hypothetical protein
MFVTDEFTAFSSTGMLLSEVSTAANLNSGSNPAYTDSDFTSVYTQFSTIPSTLLQNFISMANASLSYSKYSEAWAYCMGLYVAHFCESFSKAAKSGDPNGLKTAKSVGDVSVSYDVGTATEALKGFGSFLTTTYGQQLAQFAKMAGMGGMLVW